MAAENECDATSEIDDRLVEIREASVSEKNHWKR
jgi:hypothetical protein